MIKDGSSFGPALKAVYTSANGRPNGDQSPSALNHQKMASSARAKRNLQKVVKLRIDKQPASFVPDAQATDWTEKIQW